MIICFQIWQVNGNGTRLMFVGGGDAEMAM
jgi:hypothetical protein